MCNLSEALILCWAVLVNLGLDILKSALIECSCSLMLTYYEKFIFFLVIRLYHLPAGVAQTLRDQSLCVEIKLFGLWHRIRAQDQGTVGLSRGPPRSLSFKGSHSSIFSWIE